MNNGYKEQHPCFSEGCNGYGRIHLPVAPACNIQCAYCLRRFDCVNESRPGVVAKVMEPSEAALWCREQCEANDRLKVAGIAGPGDALANWPKVKEALRLIKSQDHALKLCLSTNGLLLPEYAQELSAVGIGYVTVTINALDQAVGGRIYEYINFKGRRYYGTEAAGLLWQQQQQGVALLVAAGLKVKVNTVAIPEVNFAEIPKIAQWAGAQGLQVMNIIPFLPVAGSKMGHLRPPTSEEIKALREAARPYIRQMDHCRRCRADVVGLL